MVIGNNVNNTLFKTTPKQRLDQIMTIILLMDNIIKLTVVLLYKMAQYNFMHHYIHCINV